MWRFKASKYKNVAPKTPKKEEWITNISAANLLHSCGNHMAASCAFMVFNTDVGAGSCLGILPLEAQGKQIGGSEHIIRAHADFVTDFAFSPFDDYLLASCSQDCTVNIWNLPKEVEGQICNPTINLAREDRRIENVCWNPTAEGALAVTSNKTVRIYDVSQKDAQYVLEPHTDQIQSISWRGDGSVFVTSCKDKKLRIIDPRANNVAQEANGHDNIKDSRAVWMGNKELILTSGFSRTHERELAIRDIRNLSSPISSKMNESSSGLLIPLYDEDTGMLIAAGVGDTCIRYLEATDKELIENAVDTVEQVKGMCLIPKRAVDVMQGEVNRLLLLSQQHIIPIPYIVPRKSYAEFHAEVFPDTNSGIPGLSAKEWFHGDNNMPAKISLDPSTTKKAAPTSTYAVKCISEPAMEKSKTAPKTVKNEPMKNTSASSTSQTEVTSVKPSQLLKEKQAKLFSGVHQSKFKHLEGSVVSKGQCIDNLRNISCNIPGESDMFCANPTFCAIPLGGSGGLVAVLKTTHGGRLPDTGVPALQNASPVMDFTWDPFDDQRLVVACDDAKIRVWHVPKDGLEETMTEPDFYLKGHTEKIYFVRFHPLASDVVASAAYDMTVKIWDITTEEVALELDGHTDMVFCLAWSPDGAKCATVCKDGKIRVYEPRSSPEPIGEGTGPEGSRGARVVWVCGGRLLAVTGFNKSSGRIVLIYNPDNLATPISSIELDTSPAILIPFFDEDTATLFLTGRGDSIVRAYEVVEDHPHLFELSPYKAEGVHQALGFLPKTQCDVKKVEFARAMRLIADGVQPVAFTLPRVKQEFFQDDVFPETKVTWEPVMTSDEWFSGVNRLPKRIPLKPADMEELSKAPVEAPRPKKYESFKDYEKTYKTEDQKKEELLSAMTNKMSLQDDPLPQDLAEGVDSDEWEDY